jgi:hypothetical protein
MKVFVWNDIQTLTQNYHSDGGLVVFAEDLERAKALAITHGVVFSDDEVPCDIRDVDSPDGVEAVYLFPNAGCC